MIKEGKVNSAQWHWHFWLNTIFSPNLSLKKTLINNKKLKVINL